MASKIEELFKFKFLFEVYFSKIGKIHDPEPHQSYIRDLSWTFFLQGVEKEFEGFMDIFNKFLQASATTVDWSKIEPPQAETIRLYKSLPAPDPAEIKKMLSKLVVVKLNGGLGTSMGCRGPKSVITVRKPVGPELNLIWNLIKYDTKSSINANSNHAILYVFIR